MRSRGIPDSAAFHRPTCLSASSAVTPQHHTSPLVMKQTLSREASFRCGSNDLLFSDADRVTRHRMLYELNGTPAVTDLDGESVELLVRVLADEPRFCCGVEIE